MNSDQLTHRPPLTGVKILDFTWALVGALSTKYLGDYGATVIKIESMSRPCVSRFIKQIAVSDPRNPDDKPWFSHLNTSKRSFALNLKHPRSEEVLDRFISWADVVTENFSPGTMARLGLDYDSLSKKRPDIIMASGSVYGQTGPLAPTPGIDSTGASLAGRVFLTGWPDRQPPVPAVPYGDVVLPKFIAGTIAAALDYRRRSGHGTHIDASMYEVLVQQLIYPLAQTQTGDSRPVRMGNRSEYALYQGVFPCKGEDNWIALTIFNRDDWHSFTELVGGDWPTADQLLIMTNDGLEALDLKVGSFTEKHECSALMHDLQGAGIAAGVAQDIESVFIDPQLRYREVLADLDHPILGKFGHQVTPFRLSRTPARVFRAPGMGEHTDEICRDVLGYTDAEITRLREEKVLF